MECRLRQVGKAYHAAFRVGRTEYTHSLRTTDRKEAETRLGVIRDTLYRLENKTLTLPAGVDPKAFVLSGGREGQVQASEADRLTLGRLSTLYLDGFQGEPNTKATAGIHFRHLKRLLGDDAPILALSLPKVNQYAQRRGSELWRGKPIGARTIHKEIQTFRSAWAWAVDQGHLAKGPDWAFRSVRLPKSPGREPFRSYDQIARLVARGGAGDEAWEGLYLDGPQVDELLVFLRPLPAPKYVYPMVEFVALTGVRRSEMARSRIEDWDFGAAVVNIREKKRDASKTFTIRQVSIHPRLSATMQAWFAEHPGGNYAFTADGSPLIPRSASRVLRRLLDQHPKWTHVKGFHVLRHSVCSILASKNVDQRYIDRILGHSTEEMRLRYRHLFPKGMADAIGSIL